MQYQSIPIKQANLLSGLLDSSGNYDSGNSTPKPGALRESQEQQMSFISSQHGHQAAQAAGRPSRASYAKGPHHRRSKNGSRLSSFRKSTNRHQCSSHPESILSSNNTRQVRQQTSSIDGRLKPIFSSSKTPPQNPSPSERLIQRPQERIETAAFPDGRGVSLSSGESSPVPKQRTTSRKLGLFDDCQLANMQAMYENIDAEKLRCSGEP